MTHRYPDSAAHARRRGLVRIAPTTLGIAALGGAATVTIAVGLAVTRSAGATPTPRQTVPASTSSPAGASTTTPPQPRAPAGPGKVGQASHVRQQPQVAPATSAPATAKSSGS